MPVRRVAAWVVATRASARVTPASVSAGVAQGSVSARVAQGSVSARVAQGSAHRELAALALAALVALVGGCADHGGIQDPARSSTGAATTVGADRRTDPGATGARSGAPDPGQASSRGGDPSTDSVRRAAADLLGARSVALADRDRGGWLATVADPDSDEGRRQAAAYDALVALGVREQRVGAVRDLPGVATGGSLGSVDQSATWTGRVDFSWEIAGYDSGARTTTRTVTLRSTSAGWRVARDGGPTDQLQVWDLGAIHVERSPTTLVAGTADVGTLRARLADAEAAQPRLARLFGAPVRAVLVVPADAAAAARQLGRPDTTSLGALAAATDGPLGPDGRAVADRVVVNPEGFAVLTDEGRRVVVAHELTHVAVRATTPGDVPTWLSEGFAEYVALQGVSLPDTTVAGQLLQRVRAVGAPQALPAAEQFEPTRADAATAYQGAWLAVRWIADRFGEGTLLAFYHAAASAGSTAGPAGGPTAPSTDSALRDVLGMTPEDFVRAWQSELARLAGQ